MKCEICDKEAPRGKKYCSNACKQAASRRRRKSAMEAEQTPQENTNLPNDSLAPSEQEERVEESGQIAKFQALEDRAGQLASLEQRLEKLEESQQENTRLLGEFIEEERQKMAELLTALQEAQTNGHARPLELFVARGLELQEEYRRLTSIFDNELEKQGFAHDRKHWRNLLEHWIARSPPLPTPV